MALIGTSEEKSPRLQIHSAFVRTTHWINAIAIIVMIGSGWRIYNNVPIFEWLHFPEWATFGGIPDLSYKTSKDGGFANALLWHFSAMWVFFINGTLALGVGLWTRRLQMHWLPIKPADLVHDVTEALKLNLAHDDITVYNAVQKLTYVGVVAAAILMVVSGLAIWKPVQFQTLTWLFYDFQGARFAHFVGMAGIVAFMIVHVALAFVVPKTIAAMTRGSIEIEPGHESHAMKAGE